MSSRNPNGNVPLAWESWPLNSLNDKLLRAGIAVNIRCHEWDLNGMGRGHSTCGCLIGFGCIPETAVYM